MADGILNPIEQLEADFDFEVYTKQEVDALLDEKADKSDTYTKTETDALLNDKADADAVYTKTETDTLLSAKADKSTTLAGYGITDAYTKTQTDTLLNGKADADSVYTKTEINTKIPNTVGSATKPIYVNGGILTECTHELNKTVPVNAIFTDTTYSAGNGLNLSGTSFSAKAGTNVTVDGNGINVNGNGAVASADSGLINGGTAYTELRPTLDGTWVKNAQTTATNLQKLEGGIEYLYGLLSHQYDQLKKYINGNYYDYDTDTNSAYTKTVLAGAMPYASLDSIGGKTVVWNQLMYDGNFTDATVWRAESVSYSATSVANNELSITVIQTPTAFYNLGARRGNHFTSYVAGHKYLMQMEVYLPYASSSIVGRNPNIIANNASGQLTIASNVVANTWTQCSGIFTAKQANNIDIYIAPNTFADYQVGDVWKMRNYILVDLTSLYEAGNEPSTVEEFQQMFPSAYYSYNAGTLLSAGVTEVVSKGKNLLPNTLPSNTINATIVSGGAINSATNARVFAIPCLPNTDYMLSQKATPSAWGRVGFANVLPAVGNTIDDKGSMANRLTFSINSGNNHYMIMQFSSEADFVSNVNNNEPMIEIGTTKTDYSPYHAPIQYPIPAEIRNLEGYGWSAGTVSNYIDYERKVFVQNVGRLHYDSTGWTLRNTQENGTKTYSRQETSVTNFNGGYISNVVKGKVTAYVVGYVGGVSWMYDLGACMAVLSGGNYVYLNTTDISNTDLNIYYPLATPIETDISAYLTDDNLIEVESGGSLTFPNSNGDDYRIPVPSAETYMVDLQSAI